MNKQLQTVKVPKKGNKPVQVTEGKVCVPDIKQELKKIDQAVQSSKTLEMNPNAKKWVEALESGRYKKCRGALRKTYHGEELFCVLGVATDLYIKEYTERNWEEISKINNSCLLKEVQHWLGLRSQHGSNSDGSCSLVSLNDDSSRIPGGVTTFKKLAAFIRNNYNGLFTK